eukprot:10200138-Prorocentrum_lima.AAC.1
MKQHIRLLEQQQAKSVDASERIKFECQVLESCGMQQAMENRLPTEQNHQARALIEATSSH